MTERTMRRFLHGAQFDLDGGRAGVEQTTNGGEGEGTSDETATTREGRKPGAPPVDLLIRTSGETRLSDCMLWGYRGTPCCASGVLWPDFSFTDMCCAVWTYQRWRSTRAAAERGASREGRRRGRATRSAIRGGRAGGAGERRGDDRRAASDGDDREEASGTEGSVGSAGPGRRRRRDRLERPSRRLASRVGIVVRTRGRRGRFVAERNRRSCRRRWRRRRRSP